MVAEKLTALRPNAWLLDFGQAFRAAVGTRVLLQLIDKPKLNPAPGAPSYCRNTISWQGRMLPVMDLVARMGGETQNPSLLVVVGYQNQKDEPTRFGALLLDTLPVAIAVGDAQFCSLPEHPAGWNKFALSCFDYQGTAIPVLHLGRIFLQE
jgi:chemotaxis signal transduction protein